MLIITVYMLIYVPLRTNVAAVNMSKSAFITKVVILRVCKSTVTSTFGIYINRIPRASWLSDVYAVNVLIIYMI